MVMCRRFKYLIIVLFLILSVQLSGQIIPGVVASSVQSAPNTLLTNILAYWKYNESSGTNLNDEVSTHDQTAQTGTTTGATGKLSYGVDFTTSTCDTYMPNFNISGDKLTISVWFKLDILPSTAGRDYCIVSSNHGTAPYYAFNISIKQTTNYISFKINNTTPTTYTAVTANSVVTTGTWYNLVCICRGTGQTMKIYLNNSDITNTSDTFTGTIFQNSASGWSWGNTWYDGDGTNGVDGIMDEIGVWDKAVTTTEISTLWNGGTGKSHPFN